MAGLPTIPVSALTSTGLVLSTQAQWESYFTQVFQGLYGADIVLTSDSPDGQLMNIFIQAIMDNQDLMQQVYSSFDPTQAFGVSLDQREGIKGLVRLGGTFSLMNVTVVTTQSLTLYGMDQTANPIYTISDSAGNQWQLQSTLAASSGNNSNVIFEAVLPGPVDASPNAVTIQVTVTSGVTSVNNPQAPYFVGVAEESDSAFKVRGQTSQQNYFSALYTALSNISGVSSINIIENDTDGTVSGTPSHSIWVIVGGNAAALDIANAIYQNRNAGAGMRGGVSYPISRPDGSTVLMSWDVVTALPMFIQLFVQSIDGVTVPNVENITNQLSTFLVPGVGASVNINEISTLVQEIDTNSLATFNSNAYMPSNGGASLTDGSFSSILSPTALNNQLTLTPENTIVYPIIIQGSGVIITVSGTSVTTRVSIAHGSNIQLSAIGGYSGGSGYTFSLTTNNSGGSCTSNGLYTAGSTHPVTDIVTVTDGNGQTSTISISVT